MEAARHKPVWVHISYRETDFISEDNSTLALVESNNPSASREFVHEKNSKQNLPVEKVQTFTSSPFLESPSQDTSLGTSSWNRNMTEIQQFQLPMNITKCFMQISKGLERIVMKS